MSRSAQAQTVVLPMSWMDAARVYITSDQERQLRRKFAMALAVYFPINVTNDLYLPFFGQLDTVALPVNAAFAVFIGLRLRAIRRGR